MPACLHATMTTGNHVSRARPDKSSTAARAFRTRFTNVFRASMHLSRVEFRKTGETMTGSLNLVQLIGHVGKEPEVKTFQDGGKVANFTLATSEKWKDKQSGEPKERTQWHNIAVFNEALV